MANDNFVQQGHAKTEPSTHLDGTGQNHDTASNKHRVEFGERSSVIGQDFQDLGKITKKLATDAMHSISENSSEYYEQGIEQAKKMELNLEKKSRIAR